MAISPHVKPVFQFIDAVKAHVRVILTSSLLILAVGLTQTFGPTGHTLFYGAAYAAIIVVGLFVAFYRAWNDQKIEKEKALARLEEATSAPTLDWKAEWKELEERFTQFTNAGARAHYWHHFLDRSEHWDIQGASLLHTDQIKSLCEMAGKLLVASPHIELPSEIKAVTSNEWRWLYFLKATYPHFGEFEQFAEVTKDAGEHPIIEWCTRNVAQLSAQACLKCAALEYEA